MIRQFSILSAIVLVGLIVSVPVEVQAETISSGPESSWHSRMQTSDSYGRTGTLSVTSKYIVQYRLAHQTHSKGYSTLSTAISAAKTEQVAQVVDGLTGSVIYSNVSNLYRVQVVQIPGMSPSTLNQKQFSSVAAAIAAVTDLPDAMVLNRISGAMVWTNADNYLVVASGQGIPYESYGAALTAASALQASQVESMPTGMVVWQANYDVLTSGSFVKSFSSLNDAKQMVQSTSNSEVIQVSTGKDVFDNIPRYNVYQNGTLLKQFSQKQDALSFAAALSNVTVVDISTQAVIYSNVPQYLVEVGSKIVKSFAVESTAIAFAKTQSGAVVVQISNNQIVWSTAGNYGVYRYLQLVRSFATLAQAEAYAKTLDHVQVIQTSNNQVEYSNYPTAVKSPYGDTFSVENGMVVDHWGATNTVLAPAPMFMRSGESYVSNDYAHWYEVLPSGDQYVGMWENPYQTLNLETSSTLTAAQINAFLATHAVSSSVLQNTGAYFIEAQKSYGVSAQYLVAHAIIESAWGTSYFARNRNNLFGYEAYTSDPNAAASFRSIEYDINFQAWFVRNAYLNPNGSFYNGSNLDGMNVDYATDPYWANSIARVMSEIAPFTQNVASAPVLPEQGQRAVFAYPKGATGLAVSNLTVYNIAPDTSDASAQAIGHIAKGTLFSVYGDSPGWDQVQLSGGQTGFVDWNGVSLQNMVAVINIAPGSGLNVRSTPTVSNTNVVDQVPNNSYLVVLQSTGKGWDLVMDGNGKQGYVAASYVQVIH